MHFFPERPGRPGALLAAAVLLGAPLASAADLHVDPVSGIDSAAGSAEAPLKTVAMAIKRAAAGDVIHLVHHDRPWEDLPFFHDKSGEPGKPIVLDGHGAVLTGAVPLDPAQWKPHGEGLFSCNDLLPRPDPAIIARFFFLFDGRMNRMGRSLKGPKEPWKAPGELEPGEWCWIEDEQAFYLRIPPGMNLAEAKVEAPLKSNGVAIAGDCNHLVIRNVTSTHVYNDGFNIHGRTRDVRFENVKAIECGDDGISAHGDCRIIIDGMLSTGNSTGVCHVNDSHSVASRMTIQANHGHEYFVLDTGRHELRDSVIRADAAQSVTANGAREEGGGQCELILANVRIEGTGQSDVIKANRRSLVTFDKVTVAGGLSLSVAGDAFTLRESLITGTGERRPSITVYPHVKWRAARNAYDLETLRIGDVFYRAGSFSEYQAATGEDAESRWLRPGEAAPDGFGAE